MVMMGSSGGRALQAERAAEGGDLTPRRGGQLGLGSRGGLVSRGAAPEFWAWAGSNRGASLSGVLVFHSFIAQYMVFYLNK